MMKKLLVLLGLSLTLFALACSGCGSTPINPTPTVGGATAYGGTSPTGGTSAAGGTASSLGGSPAALGGSSATTTAFRWLACNETVKAKPITRHLLSGWHHSTDRAKHHRIKASYSLAANSAFWAPNIKTPLDQGNLGSCTGNAVAQNLSTFPFPFQLTEGDAVKIYSLATQLDSFAGTYPPTDTGSDGQSAARAAKQLGYTTLDYGAVDTVEGLQAALQRGPCIIGTTWYSGFSNPTRCGEMQLTGTSDGGHEVNVVAFDRDRKAIAIRNSWGDDFGNCRDGAPDECGYAYWSLGTVQSLLKRGAEVDCPMIE